MHVLEAVKAVSLSVIAMCAIANTIIGTIAQIRGEIAANKQEADVQAIYRETMREIERMLPRLPKTAISEDKWILTLRSCRLCSSSSCGLSTSGVRWLSAALLS